MMAKKLQFSKWPLELVSKRGSIPNKHNNTADKDVYSLEQQKKCIGLQLRDLLMSGGFSHYKPIGMTLRLKVMHN